MKRTAQQTPQRASNVASHAPNTSWLHVAHLRPRSIGLRLLLAFMALIVLTAAIGVLSVQRLSQLTTAISELNTHDLPEIIAIGRLRTALYQQLTLDRALLASDEQSRTGVVSSAQAGMKTVLDDRATLLRYEPPDTGSPPTPDTKLVNMLLDGTLHIGVLTDQLIALTQNGQDTQARTLEQTTLEPLFTQSLANTSRLRTLEQGEAASAGAQAQQEATNATQQIIGLTALAIVVAIILAVVMTRLLTRPLQSLLLATESLATGDLSARAPNIGGEEFVRLAGAFNTMGDNLRATISSLAHQRSETQAIIDTTTDGVLVADEHRAILLMNPAAEALTGWSEGEAQGHHCWEVFGCQPRPDATDATDATDARDLTTVLSLGAPDTCACGECPLASALQGGASLTQAEMRANRFLPEQRWLAVSCAPMPPEVGDATQRLVVCLHDITQLKLVEKMKSDFVAMVSHELRSPLTTVSGSVELLGELDPAKDQEAHSEVLTILRQQTLRLRGVVEEVLQLTRLEAGNLHIRVEEIALVPFVESLFAEARVDWIGAGHALILCAPQSVLTVLADPNLLRLALTNLLDNARKYAPADSPVTIDLSVARDHDLVEVRVIDQGKGIPLGQREAIFERFVRGAPHQSENRGYGLGLYITQQIVRAHGQTIWVDAAHDGTCFAFTLAATQAPMMLTPTTGMSRPTPDPRREAVSLQGGADELHHIDD